MKYFVNEKVKVNGSEKVISEVESINGVLIYYMTDDTSYSEDQICNEYSDDEIITKLGDLVIDHYLKSDRFKKTINAMSDWYKKNTEEYEMEIRKENKPKNKTLWEKIKMFFSEISFA